LEQFAQQLTDRFGPMPVQVQELLKTLRLQWIGKSIGFEKISLKKNTLKGYFISDQQSKYFETEQFGRVLRFVQGFGKRCNLKEVKKTLRLAIEDVRTLDEAISLLSGIAEPELV
ncbi:MAG TPA: TRCF domain-containing protein, partial [Sphingobacteriaceae bacterium]